MYICPMDLYWIPAEIVQCCFKTELGPMLLPRKGPILFLALKTGQDPTILNYSKTTRKHTVYQRFLVVLE